MTHSRDSVPIWAKQIDSILSLFLLVVSMICPSSVSFTKLCIQNFQSAWKMSLRAQRTTIQISHLPFSQITWSNSVVMQTVTPLHTDHSACFTDPFFQGTVTPYRGSTSVTPSIDIFPREFAPAQGQISQVIFELLGQQWTLQGKALEEGNE